jgi:hypothetical protein
VFFWLEPPGIAGASPGRACCLSDVAVVKNAIPRPGWPSRILARRKDWVLYLYRGLRAYGVKDSWRSVSPWRLRFELASWNLLD